MRVALTRAWTPYPMCAALAFLAAACVPVEADGTGDKAQLAANSAQTATSDASSSETAAQTEGERLNAFFARTYQEDLDRSPELQSYRGIKTDYDKWDDLSDAFTDRTAALMRARMAELEAFDLEALSEADKLSYDVYKVNLERWLAADEYRHHDYVMNQFRARHTSMPSFMVNIHRVNALSDLEAYIGRLEKVGTLFDQVIDQMQIREEMGIFPPRWTYPMMIEAARNVITGAPYGDGDASILWTDFLEKLDGLDLDDETAAALRTRGEAALTGVVQPAYERLIAALERQQPLASTDDGAWKLPDGDAYYAERLSYYTTTDMTADEVHEMGLANVERIHSAMEEIMVQVGFDGTLQEFFEFMRTDPQFYYPTTDEGRARYLAEATELIDIMTERLPEVFLRFPEAELVVKRVEPFRERSAGKAFYQRPAVDGSRPGTYYANLYDMSQMPIYQMEALAYHEGNPGHHMQIAIAQELDGLPEFRKHVRFTAYTEGWGLYSEYLPKEMGFYEDPYSDFGRLAMELWRACRLVVDTGIHARKWTREEAVDYLVENTPNPRADAQKAIERYIVYTGQATAYLIGKEKILQLREDAKADLGDAFDIRAYHDVVLKDGPLPLSILEDRVAAWVAQTKEAATP